MGQDPFYYQNQQMIRMGRSVTERLDFIYDHDLDNGVYDHDLDDHHHDFDYGNNFCFRSKDLLEGACLHRSETHKRPVHKSFWSFS